ncbi:MAG TPA: phage holin family protein [Gaiellales bacterium]|nr:phage holin family protein [Gaiellales bacterium]
MSRVEADKRSESTAELVKDLSREVSELVRQELALARAEMMQKGRKAGRGAGMLSGAAVLGLAAVGGSMATLILVLDLVMPAWLAALIVTAAYAAVAAVLGLRGKEEISEAGPPAPEQTVESVKEDVQWAKTRATSSNR